MNETATPPPPPPAPPSTPEPPASGGGSESSNRSLMVVLSYLWLLAIIPLILEKEDDEVKWHAKHGLVLFVAEILILVAVTAVTSILACLGCIAGPVIMLGFLVVRVMCMVKGLNGERFTLPVISDFADKF